MPPIPNVFGTSGVLRTLWYTQHEVGPQKFDYFCVLMNQTVDELKKVQELLRLEKEADLEYYQRKVLNASLEDKKNDGVCWYPVTLTGQRYSMGEKLIVKVLRQTDAKKPHVFQSGKIVSLFSSHNTKYTVSGVVNEVRYNMMTITLNTDALPNWIDEGSLGIDLLFDELAYREMDRAMKKVMDAKEPRLIALREILLGNQPASFAEAHPIMVPSLNDSQNEALRKVMEAQDVAIIHGPPGTGKTTTMVQAILQTVKDEKKVLVCAPSNAAVDLLTEKLTDEGVNVVRIGHPARVTEGNLSKTIDAQIAQHDYYKELKKTRRRAEEFRELGKKYKRNFGRAEREQRKQLLSEASRLRDEADQLEYYIVADIFAKSDVITSTLVGASNNLIKGFHFQTAFIDEAAQALEGASWIPILKCDRVVLAGDHCQLPPTVKSYEAARQGLGETLMEKCIRRQQAYNTPVDVMLQTQYRMHEKIMNFSSGYFYNNELKAHESVRHVLLAEDQSPVNFIDTAGCGFAEKKEAESMSTYNDEEATLLLKHLDSLVESLGVEKFEQEAFTVGIIAPYKAQVRVLTDLYLSYEHLQQVKDLITIDTVDAFQGRERDIIYISLVRSNDKGEIGFLGDTRRMNVAMTRAKKKLVMIGDSATLGSHEFYSAFLDYIQEIEAYQSAFEIMYS